MLCDHCGHRPAVAPAYGDQVCQPCLMATADTHTIVIADYINGLSCAPHLVPLDEHTAATINLHIR